MNEKYSSFVFAAAGLFYDGIAVGEKQSFFGIAAALPSDL